MSHDHVCEVSHCDRPTQDVICSSHTDEVVAALMSVVSVSEAASPGSALSLVSSLGLWDELEVTLTRQHKLASVSPARKSDETPVPFHEAASDAKDGLRRFVWYWAYCFANANQHLEFKPTSVPAACEWMARFPALIASLDGAGDMWTDIVRETRQARQVIDSPPSRVYLGRCGAALEIGECEQHLYAPKGKGTVRCPSCESVWDAGEKQAFLVSLVADKTVTAVEVSRLLGAIGVEIAASTVRTYAQVRVVQGLEVPPKLRSVGRGPRNRPLYRVGDVLDIFLANQAA